MTNVAVPPLHVLSICSGVGGLDLGVHRAFARAGFRARTVCYVEREAFAASVLVSRMEEGALDPAPVWSDLTTFDPGPWAGVVDCIAGGIPCQPFSVAGKKREHADERHLWPYVERFAQVLRPRFVLIENVGGHLARGTPDVARSLRAMGYEAAATLWRASDIGAPHRRERIFILGVASGA